MLVANELEDPSRLDLGEANVPAAHRGDDPHEGPAVGVEHRQRPQVGVVDGDVEVDQGVHDVHPCISVRDHHALWLRCRSAGVVQSKQVTLIDLGTLEGRLGLGDLRVVLAPSLAAAGAAQRDELLDSAELAADAVHRVEIVGVDAQHLGARVSGDVDEIIGGKAVVDGHQDRADLRNGIEGLELLVRVGRDVGDAISLGAPPTSGRTARRTARR